MIKKFLSQPWWAKVLEVVAAPLLVIFIADLIFSDADDNPKFACQNDILNAEQLGFTFNFDEQGYLKLDHPRSSMWTDETKDFLANSRCVHQRLAELRLGSIGTSKGLKFLTRMQALSSLDIQHAPELRSLDHIAHLGLLSLRVKSAPKIERVGSLPSSLEEIRLSLVNLKTIIGLNQKSYDTVSLVVHPEFEFSENTSIDARVFNFMSGDANETVKLKDLRVAGNPTLDIILTRVELTDLIAFDGAKIRSLRITDAPELTRVNGPDYTEAVQVSIAYAPNLNSIAPATTDRKIRTVQIVGTGIDPNSLTCSKLEQHLSGMITCSSF